MPHWSVVRTVLLDMDGTLLDLNFDNYFWQELLPRRYAARRGLDLPTAKALLAPRFAREAGTLNWYCLDYWKRELGLDLARLKQECADLIALRPHALTFLEALGATRRQRVVVTNAHRRSLALKLERTRLHAHVDAIVSAHDFGLPKESPAFWARLQARIPFDPARTLLIDDSLAVLRSARDCGISQLLAVRCPDSQRGVQETAEFTAVDDFRAIIPPTLTAGGPCIPRS
ncbi:MAG TPA: GMP/IMP nucleotidase [Gammaproteobacteria bacterium]|nr:GMP/IMP nucleotidase [Gammaproteobacteria bacterium]